MPSQTSDMVLAFHLKDCANPEAYAGLIPSVTSQTCPECGTIKAKPLRLRVHACDCGGVLDRDVAAAMVVHERAFGSGRDNGLRRSSRRVAA